MENDQKAAFLPFNAINEFMLDDFRAVVIRRVIKDIDLLPNSIRNDLINHFKRNFKIPGFRNPLTAPSFLKERSAISSFERNPDFTALVIYAWCDLNKELRDQVFGMLIKRGWVMLPVEADRTKVPGFLTRWLKSETYEALNQDYKENYPDSSVGEDDVRLMVVWLSGRLPYEMVDKIEDEPGV